MYLASSIQTLQLNRIYDDIEILCLQYDSLQFYLGCNINTIYLQFFFLAQIIVIRDKLLQCKSQEEQLIILLKLSCNTIENINECIDRSINLKENTLLQDMYDLLYNKDNINNTNKLVELYTPVTHNLCINIFFEQLISYWFNYNTTTIVKFLNVGEYIYYISPQDYNNNNKLLNEHICIQMHEKEKNKVYQLYLELIEYKPYVCIWDISKNRLYNELYKLVSKYWDRCNEIDKQYPLYISKDILCGQWKQFGIKQINVSICNSIILKSKYLYDILYIICIEYYKNCYKITYNTKIISIVKINICNSNTISKKYLEYRFIPLHLHIWFFFTSITEYDNYYLWSPIVTYSLIKIKRYSLQNLIKEIILPSYIPNNIPICLFFNFIDSDTIDILDILSSIYKLNINSNTFFLLYKRVDCISIFNMITVSFPKLVMYMID